MKKTGYLGRVIGLSLVILAGLPGAAVLKGAETYRFDNQASAVLFYVRHMGVANAWGWFREFSGTIVFDEEDLAASKVTIEVAADSIDTNLQKRDDHLRGPDFFSVKQYPKITFESREVKEVEGKEGEYAVTGDLSLHGVTKEVTALFEFFGKGKHLANNSDIAGAEGTFTVKRSDFGMDYGVSNNAIGDEVTLIVSVEGVKE
ncbi:MAG: YceI family protein [Verrucomicrobiota bacterium]